jgi:hypothetical protein
VEPIEERISYFKRHEERWRKPMKMMERFKLVLINPSKAVWDITHRPSGNAFGFLFFMNSLLFGLVGVVFVGKINLPPGYNQPMDTALFYLGAYVTFVVIGMIYFLFLWLLLVLAHTYGAKFGLNIITKGKKLGGVIYWMFLPSIFATGLYVAILAIGLPIVTVKNVSAITDAVILLFNRGTSVFIAADIVQIVVYFGYMSILFSFVFRELFDKSTQNSLITSVITGLVCMGIFIMTRSTLAIGIF